MKLFLLFLFPVIVSAQVVRRGWYESADSRRHEVTSVDPVLKPFYHGVASGDPLIDRAIIWTRVTPEVADTLVTVRWIVATDTTLRSVVRTGEASTTADRDFTVKVDVDGLLPGTTYYYGFEAYGRRSLTGRFRTLFTNDGRDVRLAVVSCSNYPAGYFNAYGVLALRDDLDALLHLGDYIYEYSADSSSYAGATGVQLGRPHEPSNEAVSLTDYRTRYSQYRLDPDLRRLHQQLAMIHVWDDHESANDAWDAGAENHTTSSEGEWSVRKAISKRVCMEWLPTREQPNTAIYRRFNWGPNVDLWMLDTRQDGRSKQAQDQDSVQAPDHNIMSGTQFTWLTDGLSTSSARWKVIGNQVLFSPITPLPIDTTTLWNQIPPAFKNLFLTQLPALEDAMRLGFINDNWNNYPRQQNALIDHISRNAIKNVVFATGDFHTQYCLNNTWANEFVCSSVSAPNFDENFNSVPLTRLFSTALVVTLDSTLFKNNASLRALNLVKHGFYVLTFGRTSAQADYYFIDTLLLRTTAHSFDHGYTVRLDSTTMLTTSVEVPRGNNDTPTPILPPTDPVSVREVAPSLPLTILSVYPLPATREQSVSYVVQDNMRVSITLVDARGGIVQQLVTDEVQSGLHSITLDVRSLSSGRYTLRFVASTSVQQIPIIVAH